jgi:hypothetical protein
VVFFFNFFYADSIINYLIFLWYYNNKFIKSFIKCNNSNNDLSFLCKTKPYIMGMANK